MDEDKDKDKEDEELEDEELEAMAEQVLRIADLRQQVEAAVDGPIFEGRDGEMPLSTQEDFWRYILEMEMSGERPLAEILRERCGFEPVSLEELDSDAAVSEALWNLIGAMAEVRHFIHHTDHLSDRELYRLLLERVLPTENPDLDPAVEINTRHPMDEYTDTEAGTPDETFLRYYADEEMRAHFTDMDSERPLPPAEEPPYDRDRYLPE